MAFPFGYRWTFYQLDDTFSSAFEAKVSNISILGAKSGAARNCTACPPGYHSTADNTDCKICPNGTRSLAGSDKCDPCQRQTFAAQVYSFTFATRVSEGSVTHTGEQGWRSAESTRLPPVWPGFESWRRRHMWVEFVVGSPPCSETSIGRAVRLQDCPIGELLL